MHHLFVRARASVPMTFEEKLIWAAAFVREGADTAADEVLQYRRVIDDLKIRARRYQSSTITLALEFAAPGAGSAHRKPCVHCGALAVRAGETKCLGCGAEREGNGG